MTTNADSLRSVQGLMERLDDAPRQVSRTVEDDVKAMVDRAVNAKLARIEYMLRTIIQRGER